MTSVHEIDDARRRVVVTPHPDVTGEQASGYIVDLIASRPELTGWDWIHDLRDTSGRVETRDVDRVAAAFADAPPGPTWTVFVSHDPNLALWAQVMDHQFRDRRHLVAHDIAAAHRLLDLRRAPTD